jgi:hypothetical protein
MLCIVLIVSRSSEIDIISGNVGTTSIPIIIDTCRSDSLMGAWCLTDRHFVLKTHRIESANDIEGSTSTLTIRAP